MPSRERPGEVFPHGVHRVETPIGTLARMRAVKVFTWYWCPQNDWMKSFSTKKNAVAFLLPLLKEQCVEFVTKPTKKEKTKA